MNTTKQNLKSSFPKVEAVEATLYKQAKDNYNNHLSESTKKAYKIDLDQFSTFCNTYSLDSFPATEQTILLYLSELENRNYKVSTIERKVAAISKLHQLANHDTPVTKRVYNTLTGLKKKLASLTTDKSLSSHQRTEAHRKITTDQAEAIERETLSTYIEGIEIETFRGLRDKCLLVVGFVGGFRRSELAALQTGDLKRDKDGYTITIRKSKTNQTGETEIKYLPYSTNSDLCPVRLLDQYILDFGLGCVYDNQFESYRNEFLFKRIKKGDKVQYEGITGKAVNDIVKSRTDKTFSAHSLRVGFCVVSFNNGADIASIQKQTGHKTTTQVMHYVRQSSIKKNNAVNQLSL